jgi:hypothetical protein
MEDTMIMAAFRRALVALSLFALVAPSLAPHAAWAGNIGTPLALQSAAPADAAAHADALARVQSMLARADVEARMTALGVDADAAAARVASLTPAELARLATQLEQAPAGGDGLAILGIVFLVLLALEFTGTIDIFKKVP